MNSVYYEQNGKYAVVDGIRFCRDDKTGYYLNSTLKLRLHRYVYERAYSTIPTGYEVHHIDHNRNNNEPENLKLVTVEEHKRIHGNELTDEERSKRRAFMLTTVIPNAAKWHGSPEGEEWHKKHYTGMRDKLHGIASFHCDNCGKEFQAVVNGHNRFCSNPCKSAYRRKGGADNVERVCEVCGNTFTANKYKNGRYCSRACSGRQRSKNKADHETAARDGL